MAIHKFGLNFRENRKGPLVIKKRGFPRVANFMGGIGWHYGYFVKFGNKGTFMGDNWGRDM